MSKLVLYGTFNLFPVNSVLFTLPSVCSQPLFSEDMGGPFTILHSVSHVQDGVHTLEVLLLRIQEDLEETKGSGYVEALEWITVANATGHGGWRTS